MKHRCRTLALAVALAAAVTLAAARPAVAQITATDLGTLEGFSNSFATGINASGMVVGYAVDDTFSSSRAVVWLPGSMAPLALPLLEGYTDSMAQFVSDNGLIAGACDNRADSLPQACVWTNSGGEWTVQGLGFLPGADRNTSVATGINAVGQVIGWSALISSANGGDSTADQAGFIWDSTNGMQPFTNLPTGTGWEPVTILPAYSNGISNNGIVVGILQVVEDGNRHDAGAIAWDSNTKTTVAYLESGQATAISPSGTLIVGQTDYFTGSNLQNDLFVWSRNPDSGQFALTDLGHPTMVPPSDEAVLQSLDTSPSSVTDDGKIVGTTFAEWTTGDRTRMTWMYSGGSYRDLSTLLPANVAGDLMGAAMNANGQVVLVTSMAAYFWDGTADTAEALQDLGGPLVWAYGFGDDGSVVGASGTTDGFLPLHAALWSPATVPSALDFSEPAVSIKAKTLAIKLKIVVTNSSSSLAKDVEVTEASLGGTATTTALPLALPTITPGASKTISLAFDGQGLTSGSEVELKISGTCSLGAFFTTQTVIIP